MASFAADRQADHDNAVGKTSVLRRTRAGRSLTSDERFSHFGSYALLWGNLKIARRYAKRGVQLGREGRIRPRLKKSTRPSWFV